MKILPAPWTEEDAAIAFRRGRGYLATTLRASSLQADVRDAELMLGLQYCVRGGGMPKARILETRSVEQVIIWLQAHP